MSDTSQLKAIAITAATTALTAGATVLLGLVIGQTKGREMDWRDVAGLGALGSIIGARHAVTGAPWFRWTK